MPPSSRSSPSPFRRLITNDTSSSNVNDSRSFNLSMDNTNNNISNSSYYYSSIHHHQHDENRIPFENLDPNVGNDEAAQEIIRFETGAVARDVTDRLTKKDPVERAKRLVALKEKHSLQKKVPIRSKQESDSYLTHMLQTGEQRRQKHLIKIAKEMYPEPTPKISEKSRSLAQNYKSRQEEKKKIQEARIEKEEEKRRKGRNIENDHHHHLHHNQTSLNSSLKLQEIIAERHEGHAFKPAGQIPSSPPVFLTSSPTPRVASSSPHHQFGQRPSTEQERMARFVELSQPRHYQKSEKKKSVSSSNSGRFYN